MKGCGAVSRNKPLDALGGTNVFGQGVMKRACSKGGALEPHPPETRPGRGRPIGLSMRSGARRRVTSTRCTKTGSSYPVAPQRLAPGGWEEWETRRVEFESKGRPDGCPREYRKPGVMLLWLCVCARSDGPWPARRFCEDGKTTLTEAALAGLPRSNGPSFKLDDGFSTSNNRSSAEKLG